MAQVKDDTWQLFHDAIPAAIFGALRKVETVLFPSMGAQQTWGFRRLFCTNVSA
jgi:hypothetical protein